jgi:putative hydrolase of the HAD superfamily
VSEDAAPPFPGAAPHPELHGAPVDGVIFDWGGTLSIWAKVDIEDVWRLTAAHVAEHTGADPDALLRRLIAVEDRFWDECTADPEGRSFRLVDVLRGASDDLGVDVAEVVMEEAAARQLDTWTSHVRHDPEAAGVLQRLSDAGVRVALLSNTHWPGVWHEHFLERDGLAAHIDLRVYSSDEPHMKPHPAIFAATLERLGTEPARTLMVGDRMIDDVAGGQRAGMRGVWKHTDAAWSHPGVTPDHVVRSLRELEALCGL